MLLPDGVGVDVDDGGDAGVDVDECVDVHKLAAAAGLVLVGVHVDDVLCGLFVSALLHHVLLGRIDIHTSEVVFLHPS